MATELETENICCKVWGKVMKHPTTSDITTSCVMYHWKTLFRLKCEDRDDFLAFYSKSKGILHTLKKGNSVAVTDNVFLEAYFDMVIEDPELQPEVWSFLEDPLKLYDKTLESIHANYRAHTMGEDMRGVPGGTAKITMKCRGVVEVNTPNPQTVLEHKWKYDPFPNNVEKPTHMLNPK